MDWWQCEDCEQRQAAAGEGAGGYSVCETCARKRQLEKHVADVRNALTPVMVLLDLLPRISADLDNATADAREGVSKALAALDHLLAGS